MKRIPFAPAALALAASLAVAAPALAAPKGGMGMGHGPCGHWSASGPHQAGPADMDKRLERMATRLGLSAEQKTRIESIWQETRPEMAKVRKELWEKRRALHEQTRAGYDEAAVARQAQEIGDLVERMTVLATRTHAQTWQALTPEQQKQMETRKSERPRRGGRGMQPQGQGG